MKNNDKKYFLQYQINWLNDNSQIKVWEKSRRIGATYVQAYEDVRDVVLGNVPAVWFSSADESAAKEYILYCAQWAKLFDKGARDLGEQVLESDKSIKTFTIEFTNGKRINALSSNPKAFRSKGGKVVLDEFAFHSDSVQLWKAAKPVITWGYPLRILSTHKGKQSLFYKFVESIKTFTIEFTNGKRINALSSNPKAFRSKGGKVVLDEFAFHSDAVQLWKAAKPVITWGYPLRILSTHRGKQSLFFKFVESIKSGKLNWSLHTTTIYDAVKQGLVDKIYRRKTSNEERESWLKEQEENSFDRTTWLEEYCCTPVDETTAFLSYDQIFSIERDGILADDFNNAANLYIGVDIGRKKDLTVIWIAEDVEKFLFTRKVIELERTPFKAQKEILFTYLSLPGFRRACIDATGLGMQLAEEAQDKFGRYRVEPITFTGKTKEELAYNLLRMVEDRQIFIPPDKNIREDLHSIRKVTTASNNIRFDVQQSEVSGHADRFWALALCLYAAKSNAGTTFAKSKIKRESYKLVENF